MPAGPVHFAYYQKGWLPVFIWLVASTFAALLVLRGYFWYMAELNWWIFFWYWMARYIDPDLDQPGVTQADGRMIRELGIAGVFLSSYFTFYANLMGYFVRRLKVKGGMFGGAHRSKLTHSPWGTLIRIAFLDAPIPTILTVGAGILTLVLPGTWTWNVAPQDWMMFIAGQVVSLGFADARHVYLDNKYGGE